MRFGLGLHPAAQKQFAEAARKRGGLTILEGPHPNMIDLVVDGEANTVMEILRDGRYCPVRISSIDGNSCELNRLVG